MEQMWEWAAPDWEPDSPEGQGQSRSSMKSQMSRLERAETKSKMKMMKMMMKGSSQACASSIRKKKV